MGTLTSPKLSTGPDRSGHADHLTSPHRTSSPAAALPPFAPLPGQSGKRDNVTELQIRALLADDLPIEPDLSRWFPVWGAPGLG